MPVVSDKYKKEKKSAILKSAFACFAEKGFQVATMDDIVAHSGISKGAIYHYFNSKDDIYLELMNEQTHENMEKLKCKIDSLTTAHEKLNHFFTINSNRNMLSHFQNSSRVHIEFWVYSSRNEELRELMISRYTIIKNLFKQILTEGIRNGEFSKTAKAEELSLIFWGLIDGAALHFLMLLNEHYPYENVFQEFKELVFARLGIE